MYPVRIGFQTALDRIGKLRGENFSAEALVTSVFTLEKLMRRSMRVAVVSRGFSTSQTETLVKDRGFEELKKIWPLFDRDHRRLADAVGQAIWQPVPQAVRDRNALVHGHKVFYLSYCEVMAGHVVAALEELHDDVTNRYGQDPWDKIKERRTPHLQWL